MTDRIKIEVSSQTKEGYKVSLTRMADSHGGAVGAAIEELTGIMRNKGLHGKPANNKKENKQLSSSLDESYRRILVSNLRVMVTSNGNFYLLVRGQPGLAKNGVKAWPDVCEHLIGKLEELSNEHGLGKAIPHVPEKMQWAWVLMKKKPDGQKSARKVIAFTVIDSPEPNWERDY